MSNDSSELNDLLLAWLSEPQQVWPPGPTWLRATLYAERLLERRFLPGRPDLWDEVLNRLVGVAYCGREPLFTRLRRANAISPLREPVRLFVAALSRDATDVLRRHKRRVWRTERDTDPASESDERHEPVAPPAVYSGHFTDVPRAVHGVLASLGLLSQAHAVLEGGAKSTAKRAQVAAGHLKRDLKLGAKRLRWDVDVDASDGQVRAWQATYYTHVCEHEGSDGAHAYSEPEEIPENGVDKARYDRFRTHLKRFRQLWEAGKELGLDGSRRDDGTWWDPPTHKTLGDRW